PSVADVHVDVLAAGLGEDARGPLAEGRDDLDGLDLAGEPAEDSGLIAGARPDLEDALVAAELERLAHEAHDRWLRDGRPEADRDRMVAVRLFELDLRHEPVARHGAQCGEDVGRADLARDDLDEPLSQRSGFRRVQVGSLRAGRRLSFVLASPRGDRETEGL